MWILVGDDQPKDDSGLTEDKTGGKAHGTCMLSKVAGHYFGVAKKVDPVIVRVPRRGGGPANKEDYLEGISKVYDDLMERSEGPDEIKERSVLSTSWYYPRGNLNEAWIRRAKVLLEKLVILGVSPVAGSGNLGLVSPTMMWLSVHRC